MESILDNFHVWYSSFDSIRELDANETGRKEEKRKGKDFSRILFFIIKNLNRSLEDVQRFDEGNKEISMKKDDVQFIFVSKNCSYDRCTFQVNFLWGIYILNIYIYCWTARLPFFQRRINKSEHERTFHTVFLKRKGLQSWHEEGSA